MSTTGTRINTISQMQRQQDQAMQEGNLDFPASVCTLQVPADRESISMIPSLFTGFSRTMDREPDLHQNNDSRRSFSWSMGDGNSQSEISRDVNRQYVDLAMKDRESKMAHLEGTFTSVTNELKSAIESLRPSNNQSDVNMRDSRERNARESLPERVSNRTHSSRQNIDTSSESNDSDERSSVLSSRSSVRNRKISRHPKLPHLTGKETWKVWFNRFEEVANRQNWSEEETWMKCCHGYRV